MMGAALPHTNPVTLNLFQGPWRGHALERAVARWAACGMDGISGRALVLAEKWTLKQVQGDGMGDWRVAL